jgi:hypothetical protein
MYKGDLEPFTLLIRNYLEIYVHLLILIYLLAMKKLYLLLLLLPAIARGTVYTSIANGNWGTPTTWSPNGIPGYADDVIINNTVTVAVSFEGCFNLTINSGGILSNNAGCILDIFNLLTNNAGGKLMGAGNVFFVGPVNGTVITGGGDFSSQTGNWFFAGNAAPGIATEIIDPSVTIVKNGGNLFLYTSAYSHPVRIINFGDVTMNTGALSNNGTKPCSWTQETGSLLWLVNPALTNSYDTLVASAPGNNVTYSSIGSFTIIKPFGSTYSTLHFNNGTKTLPSDLIVNGLFQIDAPDAGINFAGHNLTLGNNWINNSTGKLTNFTGTMTFNSSALQTIGGSHTTRFANVTISGTGGVTLATNEGFTGVLTLSNSGNLAGPGVDTLISTSGATARVAQIAGAGTITANFVVQRYNGRSTAQYQALSSPVQSTTLGDWNVSNRNPPFYMSGVGGPDGNAGSYVSVYIYGEATNTYNPVTNFSNPGINYVLPQGQGIYLWMGNSLVSMSPFTYITHGVPSVKNINYNVSSTPGEGNGFNIIGNPYPSPISWSNFQASNASLQATFYLFEEDGSWHTFNSGNIPMEQGFGVVSSSSTSLSFQEAHKSNVDAALQRIGDPSKEANAATFTLSDDANSYSCPTIITFGGSYVTSYNPSEDAIFISSFVKEVPKLYTTSDDSKTLALNRLPDNDTLLNIPLTAIGNVAANYTIKVKNLSSLSSYNCVSLIDKNTGAIVNNFEDSASYTFNIKQPGQEKDFILQFRRLLAGESCNSVASVKPLTNSSDSMQIYATSSGAIINFHLVKAENALVSVYSLTGQKLIEDIQFNAFDNQLNIPLPTTVQIYTLRVETPTGLTVKKLYR